MTNTDIYRTKTQIQQVLNNSQLPPVILEGVLAEALAEVRAVVIREIGMENDRLDHVAAQQEQELKELKKEVSDNADGKGDPAAKGPRS